MPVALLEQGLVWKKKKRTWFPINPRASSNQMFAHMNDEQLKENKELQYLFHSFLMKEGQEEIKDVDESELNTRPESWDSRRGWPHINISLPGPPC